MKLVDLFKKVFPKPQIPQKRYILLLILIVYAGLKVYVDHTEAEWDNRALEAGKGIILEYFADSDNADQLDDGQRYGERT